MNYPAVDSAILYARSKGITMYYLNDIDLFPDMIEFLFEKDKCYIREIVPKEYMIGPNETVETILRNIIDNLDFRS